METSTGGCHCGKVRFSVSAELANVISCNCSHCAMKGLLLAFVPTSAFELLSGEDALTEYRFNKKQIDHRFCSVCGVQPFGFGDGPHGPMAAINMRCVDGVDLDTLPVTPFDGKSQ